MTDVYIVQSRFCSAQFAHLSRTRSFTNREQRDSALHTPSWHPYTTDSFSLSTMRRIGQDAATATEQGVLALHDIASTLLSTYLLT